MSTEPTHTGCADCGTTEVPMLYSVPVPGAIMSKAVCPACALKYGVEITEEKPTCMLG